MTPRAILLARGAFNVLFGLVTWAWLLTHGGQALARGGTYALIDGLLGVLLAVAFHRASRGRWLWVLALCDGLIRLLVGSLMFANPGLQQSVLGSALFMSAIILACIVLGLGGMAYALINRSRLAAEDRDATVWPAMLVSLFTLLLGVGLAFGLMGEQQQTMLAFYALALGLVLLWAGWRAGRHPAPPFTPA